jgi:hypothetical protein
MCGRHSNQWIVGILLTYMAAFLPSMALQPFVGLRLQWADCGHVGCFLGFKNHKIYLIRHFVQEEP